MNHAPGLILRHLAALLVGLSLITSAHANTYEIFGAGARAQGMAGAGVALVSDPSAAFHNPAGLALGAPTLALRFDRVFDRTSILLMPRPDGYDPPDYGARLNPRGDTEGGVTGGVALGFTLKPFGGNFALGGQLRIPFEGFAHIDTAYVDEREQHFDNRLRFARLGERLRGEVISVGLAYRWRPWISMGFGLIALPSVNTTNDIYTPNATDPANVEANFRIEQGLEEAIVGGLILDPLEWLRVAVSLQDEVHLAVRTRNQVLLGGSEDDPMLQAIDVAQRYSPPRVTGALAILLEGRGRATFEVSRMGWSRYLDDHAAAPAPGFSDTFEWRLGAELPMENDSAARFGLGWIPSPVPAQTGRTNYVDNDRFVVSAGGGRAFELWGEVFTLDIAVQLQALITQETHKAQLSAYPDCDPEVTALCDEIPDAEEDRPGLEARDTVGLQTGNPGFPGFASGGYLLSAALDFEWRF